MSFRQTDFYIMDGTIYIEVEGVRWWLEEHVSPEEAKRFDLMIDHLVRDGMEQFSTKRRWTKRWLHW